MAEIFPFPEPDFDPEEMPLEEMTLPQLQYYLAGLEEVLEDMDSREPRSRHSDAYDRWAEEHEDLEDLMDEIRDRMDELSE